MRDLQEIIGGRVARWDASRLLRSSFEDLRTRNAFSVPQVKYKQKAEKGAPYLEVLIQMLVQLQNGGDVSAAVAVIRRGPYSHQAIRSLATFTLDGEHSLISFHDQLMRTGNQIDMIRFVEFGDNVSTEEVTGTTRRKSPAIDILRIGPHQVAHSAIVRYFLLSVNDSDL